MGLMKWMQCVIEGFHDAIHGGAFPGSNIIDASIYLVSSLLETPVSIATSDSKCFSEECGAKSPNPPKRFHVRTESTRLNYY